MLWVQCTCSLLKAVLQRLVLATTSFSEGWCSTSSDSLWKYLGLWMVEISPDALISLFLLSQCISLSITTLLFPSYLPLTLQNSINDIQKTGCMAPADWSDTVLEVACARTEVDTKSSYVPAKHSAALSFLQNANVFISLVKTVCFKIKSLCPSYSTYVLSLLICTRLKTCSIVSVKTSCSENSHLLPYPRTCCCVRCVCVSPVAAEGPSSAGTRPSTQHRNHPQLWCSYHPFPAAWKKSPESFPGGAHLSRCLGRVFIFSRTAWIPFNQILKKNS